MSSGHGHHTDFGLDSGALDRLLKNEKVRMKLYRPREIIHDYDLPYVAGYSDDGSKIYIDRHLPDSLKIDVDGKKIEFNPERFLTVHESMEKTLIDELGYGYTPAHKAATGLERRFVLQALGPGAWTPYQKIFDKYIKKDAHEKLSKLPKDLDMLPYFTPPMDHKLLNHMESVMKINKVSKEEAHYGPERGTPRRHCGPDEGWKRNYCRSFIKENRCYRVTGFIVPRGDCDLYVHADEKKKIPTNKS